MKKQSPFPPHPIPSDCPEVHPAVHVVANAVQAPHIPLPSGKRIPFGWPDFAVDPAAGSSPAVLQWDREDFLPPGHLFLRLAVSLDIRETLHVEALDPENGAWIGRFDITQAHAFQFGEIHLTRTAAERIRTHGVALRVLAADSAPRFFAPAPGTPPLLQPHILAADTPDKWSEFLKRMSGLDTLQPFSWMEGCMLEGVYDLTASFDCPDFAAGMRSRLDHCLIGPDLIYENPRSEPMDNRIYGIECTLPFAVIARERPDHPSVQRAVDFWQSHVQAPGQFAAGSIQDGALTSAEGSICVGYPLLVVARTRGDAALEALALNQFRLRKDLLVDANGDIWLRNDNGSFSFRNWARGITWYFLGLVRALVEVRDREDVDDLRDEALRVMHLVRSHQLENGLWSNFTHDPAAGIDTSGSAGIAAALALGHRHGLLPPEAHAAAGRTLVGLEAYLTPDGLLTGGTPSNRNQEGTGQRRVIFQVGMGLTAQLLAAWGEPQKSL